VEKKAVVTGKDEEVDSSGLGCLRTTALPNKPIIGSQRLYRR